MDVGASYNQPKALIKQRLAFSEKGVLPSDGLWAQTTTFSWVPVYQPTLQILGLLNSHILMIQFLKIKLSLSMYIHTYTYPVGSISLENLNTDYGTRDWGAATTNTKICERGFGIG